MTKYENTEHNVNMLVDRQEEPGGMEDYIFADVYQSLNITDKQFRENIDFINETIQEYIEQDGDMTICKEVIEEKLK
jgi:hypothetical protein